MSRMAFYDPHGAITMRVWDTEMDEEIEPVRVALGMLNSETKCGVPHDKVDWVKEGF
jgi:hypothetical protein